MSSFQQCLDAGWTRALVEVMTYRDWLSRQQSQTSKNANKLPEHILMRTTVTLDCAKPVTLQ